MIIIKDEVLKLGTNQYIVKIFTVDILKLESFL